MKQLTLDLTDDLRDIYTAVKNYRDKAQEQEDEQREAYNEMRAEARACGYEYPSFEEWLNPRATRQRAESRLKREAEDYDLD